MTPSGTIQTTKVFMNGRSQGAAMVSDDFMADGRPEEILSVRETL